MRKASRNCTANGKEAYDQTCIKAVQRRLHTVTTRPSLDMGTLRTRAYLRIQVFRKILNLGHVFAMAGLVKDVTRKQTNHGRLQPAVIEVEVMGRPTKRCTVPTILSTNILKDVRQFLYLFVSHFMSSHGAVAPFNIRKAKCWKSAFPSNVGLPRRCPVNSRHSQPLPSRGGR